MDERDIHRAFSAKRFDRFLALAGGNYSKALQLYKANIRLSSRLFAVLSLFEIMLRNAIDDHYRKKFGDNWLLSQIAPMGFLSATGCEKSRKNVTEVIHNFGQQYTHNSTVASLNFGFWCYLFAAKEFSAGGFTLLKVFPKRPKGALYNHTYVFEALNQIKDLRNRIAHHDPVCFAPKTNQRSIWMALQSYIAVREMLEWLDYDKKTVLQDVDFVLAEMEEFIRIARS